MINHPASTANDAHTLHVDQQQITGRKRKSPCDDHLHDDRGHDLDSTAHAHPSHEHVTSSPSSPLTASFSRTELPSQSGLLAHHSPRHTDSGVHRRWHGVDEDEEDEDEDDEDDESAKSDSTSASSWSSAPSTFSRSSSGSNISTASTHINRSKRPRTSPIDVDVTPGHSSFVLPATHHQHLQHHQLPQQLHDHLQRDATPFPPASPSVLSSPTMSHANAHAREPTHAHTSGNRRRRTKRYERRVHGLRQRRSASGPYASQIAQSDSDSQSESSGSSTSSASSSPSLSHPPIYHSRVTSIANHPNSSPPMSNPLGGSSGNSPASQSHQRQHSPPLTLPNAGPARGCLHQSCFFRFASMMDGMHLAHAAGQSPIYVPSMLPPINRYTLQELDLAAIMRNPQLREFSSICFTRLGRN